MAVLPVLAVALLGRLATMPNLEPWYAGLAKPGFTPPNWVFGPAWGTLYVLMAVAAWRVLRTPPHGPRIGPAIALFYLQLAFNAAWSWMFFGVHSPVLGLVNIIPQVAVIAATIVAFWRIDRIAGALLVPLAAWVGFAAALNAGVVILN